MDLHGGNVHRLQRDCTRQDKKQWLDYSANINPLGVPQSFTNALNEHLYTLDVYPDPDYVDLRQSLAEFSNVEIENILVGNGATEMIFLFFKAFNASKALIIGPTFAEYARAAESAGTQVDYFILDWSNGFKLDMQLLEMQIKRGYQVLTLCNPNNPTGNLIDLQTLKKIISLCEDNQVQLLLDEAFIEFADSGFHKSAVIFQSPSVFIVRALTKFFAVPGIRLGWAISFNEVLNTKIGQIREPWSVNCFAELAGITVVKDQSYINDSITWITNEKRVFRDLLKSLNGIEVFETNCNFILLRLCMPFTAHECREYLLTEGVIVRDAGNFIGLDSRFIRVAVKDATSNKRLYQLLKNYLLITF
ncbi:pyridoxal phosphate-dependent aminotransferase [Psychromonas ossibalaenae]|uniref:pyridoxal phosphate-dependent aminotransferase n=1 Tax=Psychromonas ossibalaenae TaxID=444922 RepID=UPI0003686240|nr:aminotransferase class I/II-fold pyridoxal phosphate-dependent enzyme [Psychromonas ossibalaenae]